MTGRRLLPLDGLRGLAVLLVVLFHTGGGAHSSSRLLRTVDLVIRDGWAGVTLFFLLSGFLVTGILWDQRGTPHWWRNFYMRRVLRIFPLYYLALLLVMVAAAYAGTMHRAMSGIWSPLLFLEDIPGRPQESINHTGSPLSLYHFWSLAVEEQFYLVWPFLLLLVRTRRGALILCSAVILVSEGLLWGQGTQTWMAGLPMVVTRGAELATGAWLAIAYRDALWDRLRVPALGLLPIAMVLFVLSPTHGQAGPATLSSATLFFACLLVLSLQTRPAEQFFSMRWLRWVGSISYGLYVYHVLFSKQFWSLGKRLLHQESGPWLTVAVALLTVLITVPVAWVSWQVFERPILRLNRYFQPQKSA